MRDVLEGKNPASINDAEKQRFDRYRQTYEIDSQNNIKIKKTNQIIIENDEKKKNLCWNFIES